MSEPWPAIAAEVSAAISDIGFPVTVTRPGAVQAVYDPTPPATTTFTCMVVDMGIKQMRQAGSSEIVFRRVILCPADTAPQMWDTVTLGGVGYVVQNVSPTAPGGVNVLVKVELET